LLIDDGIKIQCFDMLEKTKCYQRRRKELLERSEGLAKIREPLKNISFKQPKEKKKKGDQAKNQE
jgi:hypothetical protein